MDVLSDVLRSIRLSGAVLFRAEFSSPWAVTAPASNLVAPLLKPDAERLVFFHMVVQGTGWAEIATGERVSLSAGDTVMICGGHRHALGCGSPARRAALSEILPPPPWPEPPSVRYGGGGAVTTIVCGFLHCDESRFHPLLATLPALLHVHSGPSAEWIEAHLRYPLDEVRKERPGSDSLLARSAELLVLDVLRRYIAERPADELGWFGALRDPPIARALELMHEAPGAAWSVQRLAREVGVSRTVFAERFRIYLGQPPMQYLARWRLQLAARLLRESHRESLAAIAERAGYASERAFHRAFKRHAGVTPGVWRGGA
jgi:AraC-like DNA-binding protein